MASAASAANGDVTVTSDAADMICATCGKTGDGLKKCTACKSVRYCNVDCQKRHRKAHKRECKQIMREVELDAAVDAALAAKEECPICALPLPLDAREIKYQTCCGKLICAACFFRGMDREVEMGKDIRGADSIICPFCRTPQPKTDEKRLQYVQDRADRGDSLAMYHLAMDYFEGGDGVPQDEQKALELFQRAADLDNPDSIAMISGFYSEGSCGLERDERKMMEYLEKGANTGCLIARFNLGIVEESKNEPNVLAAMHHFRFSASLGSKGGLEKVKLGYKRGYLSKDQFAKTLRAYQHARDEMHSDPRDRFVETLSRCKKAGIF